MTPQERRAREQQLLIDQLNDEFRQEQRLYEEEMRMLSEGGADYAGNDEWRHLMRQTGRIPEDPDAPI